MNKTFKLFLVMMLSVVGFTFTSCSDDDDAPKGATVEEVVGKYAGKMAFNTATNELDLEVKKDSVSFEKFPYEGLVKAIITDEATAEGIIAQVGTLKYNVSYTAAMNAANDSVVVTLKPEPLKLAVGQLTVEVAIEAPNKASYSVKEKNLKFSLKAASVKVLGQPLDWTAVDLAFDMKKK